VAYDQKIFTTALTEFKNEYAQRWRQETALYPGIKELLDELGETSCKKAILSNKPHEYTIEVVAHFLANWNFDIIWGAREEVPRKPDPTAALEISRNWQLTPGSLIFVGDTSIDMQTAAAAGMYSVGVTWGFRPEELPKGAHDLIVHTPAEIVSLI
jgi:phosphoglycolate phosphatase